MSPSGDQPKNGNGRAGIIALIGGIPVALLAGAVFGAGSISKQVEDLADCNRRTEALNAVQESRLIRLETVYDRTAEDIREIKSMLKQGAR